MMGRALGIKRANMAPVVARLIEEDLLDSKRINGRSSGLSLSTRGRQIVRKAENILEIHDEEVFDILSLKDRPDLIELLRSICQTSLD